MEWGWLGRIQANRTYRLWSGLALLLYLGGLWSLTLARVRGWRTAAKHGFELHKQLGVVAPLVFFAHSRHFGYAYLLLLSIAFLGNTVVGLANQHAVPISNRTVRDAWLVTHVSLAMLVTGFVFYHIFIVFYYN